VFLEDVRYGLRVLGKQPGFAALVVLILGLSVGANTAAFSVVDDVLLRSLPYGTPERIVALFETNLEQGRSREGPSPANLADWRASSSSFEAMAGWYASKPVTLQRDGEAEKIVTASVTEDFFRVFGVAPLLGRTFDAEEAAQQLPVVVISHALWTSRFGADSGVIGGRIVLDGTPSTLLGVMPREFAIPHRDVGIWKTWGFDVAYAQRAAGVPRDARFLQAAGLLKPGVTASSAQAELDGIAAELAADHPQFNRGWGATLVSLHEELVGDVRIALWALFAAVGLVLLIACINVANLLLARAAARGREIAVRAVLGASRSRVFRQMLAEGLVIAAAGGAAGLVVAAVCLELIERFAPTGLLDTNGLSIDTRALGFTLVVTLLTTLVFGVVPALHTTRLEASGSLAGGGRRATANRGTLEFRRVLVVVQIAAALTLLVGTMLLTRSFVGLTELDPGFDHENILVVRAFPDEATYASSEKRLAYFNELAARLDALPSVESVGATTGLPLGDFNNAPARPYWPEGQPRPGADGPTANLKMTTKDYFRTIGLSLLAGRDFADEDDVDAPPVAIVNHGLASRLWPGENAVGKRVVIDYAARGAYPYEIVGVVEDSRADGLRNEAPPEIFLAHPQVPYAQMNFVLRTSGEPRAVATAAQREVLELDPAQPVHSVTTMAELVSRSLARDRFSLLLGVGLAVLAIALALSGIYGVVSYTVAERSHEIGVRMALGAKPGHVARLIVGHAAVMALAGIVIGCVASLLLTRTLSTLLYEVGATDPLTFAGASALLAAAALLASYLPARRAMSVEPVEALRHA
jgi:putative ABC transport system permease protein